MAKERKPDIHQEHLRRVRRICSAMPECAEKLSHGEPTFFVRKKVFAMFANNHHNDGHIAVWLPAPAGVQSMLIEGSPEKFFRPPYVGVRGWIGVELANVDDEELEFHVRSAWRLIAPPRMHTQVDDRQSAPAAPPPARSDAGRQRKKKQAPSKSKKRPGKQRKR